MAGGDLDIGGLVDGVDTQCEALQTEIDRLKNSSTMNPGDMLALQMQMNLFSQFNETVTSLIGATNDSIKGMLRNLKG